MKRTVIILFISVLFYSCFPKETSNPKKAFKYWAGYNPPSEFNVSHGEYYQSPHFTLEYEVYLKLEPTSEWWNGLFDHYNLKSDTSTWSIPNEAPDWFRPSQDSRMFWKSNDFERSRYFIDRKTGICFIYETLGM